MLVADVEAVDADIIDRWCFRNFPDLEGHGTGDVSFAVALLYKPVEDPRLVELAKSTPLHEQSARLDSADCHRGYRKNDDFPD